MDITLSPAEFLREAYESIRARTVSQLQAGDSATNTAVSDMLEIRSAFISDIEYGRALALRDLQSEQPLNSEPDNWLMQAYEGEIGADMQIVAGRAISAYAKLLAKRAHGKIFIEVEEGATT